ncbi:MAG: AAC(3) family N-acetyltransferase [Alphaproteobacteria bacterium]|nr:AAC(3) family N-acetyltransferase [Alphaproteobacteria bacterium]
MINLGVRQSDILMVHASLRAIGPVVGGANGVLDALCAATGMGGAVMMVLGARDDWAWVNESPETERQVLLHGSPPFDALSTPAQPDVGYLAEALRLRPGVRVTNHPEGRFAAIGDRAAELLRDPPWHDYFGPGSPLDHLCALGGHVLRLGADKDTVTLLHLAEYLAPIPHKRRIRRHRLVAAPGGPQIRVVECLNDDGEGVCEWPHGDYFEAILNDYLSSGRACIGRVGNAQAELIGARELVTFAVDWMANNLI